MRRFYVGLNMYTFDKLESMWSTYKLHGCFLKLSQYNWHYKPNNSLFFYYKHNLQQKKLFC
jgi:hypothetical protein